MKIFVPIEYEKASPEVKKVYDEIMAFMHIHFIPKFFIAQGKNEKRLVGLWENIKHTLFGGDLDILLKQLIVYVISEQRNCTYCATIHAIAAQSCEPTLTQEDLKNLVQGKEIKKLPVSFQAAIEFVKSIAKDPKNISFELEKNFMKQVTQIVK